MQTYTVTAPRDVEGFRNSVLASATHNTPFTITAEPQSEITLRREGPVQFTLTVVSINLFPTLSTVLHWVKEGEKAGQDLYFTEMNGHMQFTIYAPPGE